MYRVNVTRHHTVELFLHGNTKQVSTKFDQGETGTQSCLDQAEQCDKLPLHHISLTLWIHHICFIVVENKTRILKVNFYWLWEQLILCQKLTTDQIEVTVGDCLSKVIQCHDEANGTENVLLKVALICTILFHILRSRVCSQCNFIQVCVYFHCDRVLSEWGLCP